MHNKLIRLIALCTCLALTAGLPISPPATAQGALIPLSIFGRYLYTYESEILRIANNERTKAGNAALSFDAELQAAAELRAREIALYFSHTRPDDTIFYSISPKAHSENIAIGYGNPTSVMNGWMNSQGHRSSILSPAHKSIGVGCFVTNGYYCWVQLFGTSTGIPASIPSANQTQDTAFDVLTAPSNISLALDAPAKLDAGLSRSLWVFSGNMGWSGHKTARLANTGFTWQSSDPSALEVNNQGMVTAKKPGTVTLTGSLKAAPSIALSATVNVPGYALTVSGGQGGGKYAKGASVPISANAPPAGTVFERWTGSGGGWIADAYSPNTTFTMPAKAVTLKAVFKQIMVTGISLDKSVLTLEAGKRAGLSAKVSPGNAANKAVKWSSSNASVASVDSSGTVKAVKAGKAVITATTVSGGKTAKCTVNVISPVASIAVARKTVYLKKGASAALQAVPITADGSKAALKWVSSAPGIVSVDKKGKVKALKAGKATITATADNGKTVKLTVLSGSGKTPASLTIINPPGKNRMKPGEAIKLNVQVKPRNAQGVLAFKSSNSRVLSVNAAGQICALKPGTATITASMGGKRATLKFTVKKAAK